MQPDVTNVELNRLKGVSYAVSVTIPTVFVNEFSYYEVVGKLINHLDHIRATQDDNASNMTELSNFVYENITEQREYLNTFYNTFMSDLNTYFNESKQKWADFLEHELSRYNNYYNDLTSRMNSYTNTLQTNLNNFITNLTNKHTNYQEYLTNRHTTHTNNLQTMVNNYKSYIDTNKDNIEENFLTELEDLMTKYQNLLNSINLSKESVRVIITNKYNEWDDAVKSMITEYNDIQQRVIDNNDILGTIINYLKGYPSNLQNIGVPLFKNIKYTGEETPSTPTDNDVWLKTENIGDSSREVLIKRLYRYVNSNWVLITDSNLYITSDNHIYYATMINTPLRQEQKTTMTGEGYNPSAWWVPVGYTYDEETPLLNIMQQYNTACFDSVQLTEKVHSYTNCIAPRGYGAYNLKFKNINNDFQRVLTLNNRNVVLQSNKGIFMGVGEYPNLYENNCNTGEDTPISTNSDYTVVTGIYNIGYPIVFSTQYQQYFAYYNGQFINIGVAMPRFSVGTRIYCFQKPDTSVTPNLNNSYYIDLTNPDTTQSLTTPTHNEMSNECDTLQLSEDNKYIYSNNKVWLYADFLTSLTTMLFDLKPILVLPTSVEHAHIYKDIYYTTHTNYAIPLNVTMPSEFTPVDVDVKANGIWSEDTSTWQNGYVFGGMFWQFSLVNETDTTVPHKTNVNMQGFVIGASEINYVPISSPTN